MNRLVENGQITELVFGNNFAYVFNDSNMFYATEYKVMQGKVGKGFVKCSKMLFNGKLQLLYLTEALRPLSALAGGVHEDGFMNMVRNLFGAVLDVMDNGFLTCQSVDTSFDKIYVDPATHKVSLVYVPGNVRLHSDQSAFENELRSTLIKLVTDNANLAGARTQQLCQDLANGSLSIQAVYEHMSHVSGGRSSGAADRGTDLAAGGSGLFSRFRGGNSGASSGTTVGFAGKSGGFSVAGGFSGAPDLYVKNPDTLASAIKGSVSKGSGRDRLVSTNGAKPEELAISKTGFLIGNNPTADGYISTNPGISRMHCRVDNAGGQYTITDLGSEKGTFINGVRLVPNRAYLIKNRDVIRLADSEFRFVMG